MRPTAAFAALLAAGTLAGCLQTDGGGSTASFPPTDQDRASPAYQACAKAIASTTGRAPADIRIVSFVYSEAGSTVMATVAGAEAPWRCLSSNGGVVQEVMYTGSEGRL